jgi:hypothetical protein
VHALAEQLQGPPPSPGEPCQVRPRDSWLSQERWVWKQVCEGKIADFNTVQGYGGTLDPRKLEGWSEKRVLSPQFLETILLYEPFRSALPRYGVRIKGGWFQKPLDISHATLAHPLVLWNCRFEADVRFDGVKTSDQLALMGSKFTGLLSMDSLQVGSSLYMNVAEFGAVVLRGAKIDNQLNMSSSKFTGLLSMDGLKVGGSLLMRNMAEFAGVDLPGAK